MMSNSSLVTVKVMTKHYGYPDGKAGRGGAKIDKIFVHHMAGILTAEQCGNVFKTREASAHYGIDTKGRVGLYVDEANAAWHCGSKAYNQRSIGIELSNDGGAKTGWHVADKTIAKCIDLIVDICKRNGIKKINYTGDLKGNLCMHRWVASTACPASYLGSKFKYIAEQVNKKLGAAPAKEVLYRVRKTWADAKSQVGAYKNLANAKKVADEKHLNVYDDKGKLVYEGKKKADTNPKPYAGSYPTAAEIKAASNAGTRAYMLKWAKDIAASGKYKYKRFTDDPKTHQCPICHPNSGNGWNCMGYAIAAWKHGGKLPCNCSCAWFGDGEWDKILKMNDADALAYAQKKTGLKDVAVIRNGGKTIPTSKLMAGDILGLYDGNDIQHIVLYVGNGKITDSTSGRKPNIAYGVPMYKEYQAKVAIRYTGGKNYMQFYDRGAGVKKIKDYLVWYNPKNKFADDDVFGTGTQTAVTEFQNKEMGKGQGDGLAGQKTVDAMKKYKK